MVNVVTIRTPPPHRSQPCGPQSSPLALPCLKNSRGSSQQGSIWGKCPTAERTYRVPSQPGAPSPTSCLATKLLSEDRRQGLGATSHVGGPHGGTQASQLSSALCWAVPLAWPRGPISVCDPAIQLGAQGLSPWPGQCFKAGTSTSPSGSVPCRSPHPSPKGFSSKGQR